MALIASGVFALIAFSMLGLVLIGMRNTLNSERRMARETNKRLNIYSITRGRRR
jgi:hypothetical protein